MKKKSVQFKRVKVAKCKDRGARSLGMKYTVKGDGAVLYHASTKAEANRVKKIFEG